MPRDPEIALREDRIRLLHMVESARRAVRIASGLTAEALAADEIRALAVVKSIEIIGEAATKVGEATRQRLAGIDWDGVRQMRNRLIHGYDSIDMARVWDALSIDVPPLIREIEQAMSQWPGDAPPAP
jgi:uncharacterized protein with HEPN domain